MSSVMPRNGQRSVSRCGAKNPVKVIFNWNICHYSHWSVMRSLDKGKLVRAFAALNLINRVSGKNILYALLFTNEYFPHTLINYLQHWCILNGNVVHFTCATKSICQWRLACGAYFGL